jgi:hypothetical protein
MNAQFPHKAKKIQQRDIWNQYFPQGCDTAQGNLW